LNADSDEPTAWFADEVARRGAYAAFLGVRFKETRGPRVEYRALSVGDVCLLHVNPDGRLSSFPVTAKDDFTSQPDLISSAPGTKPLLPVATAGGLNEREYLLIASDGVAALLLGEPQLVADLLSGTPETVHSVLATARAEERMPDDDYTLIRISLARR
jgi:serine/threonine protein phosphatase PrpC